MKLAVVKADVGPSPEAMWRHFTDLRIDHASAVGSEVPIGTGRLIGGDTAVSRRLPGLAMVPAGVSVEAMSEILTVGLEHGLTRPRVLCESSLPAAAMAGLRQTSGRLFRLRAAPPTPSSPPGLMVLPVRAAHVAYEIACAGWIADDPAAVLLPRHLGDPQYDAAVAIRGGAVIGVAALQTRGQHGLVCDVWVHPAERRRGVATLLTGRMIDLAARAQLAIVYAVASDDAGAALLLRTGFAAAATFDEWTPT